MRIGAVTIGDLVAPVLHAGFASVPWLFIALGLALVFIGTVIGRPNRRLTVIGLWMSSLASLWLIAHILFPQS